MFEIFLPVIDNAAGSIIVGASTINALADVGPGSLVVLTLRVRDAAPAGAATINLRHDLNGVTTALSEGYLVLQPVPSNAAGDELDGGILVLTPALSSPVASPKVPSGAVKAKPIHPPAKANAGLLRKLARPTQSFADVVNLLNQLLTQRRKRD